MSYPFFTKLHFLANNSMHHMWFIISKTDSGKNIPSDFGESADADISHPYIAFTSKEISELSRSMCGMGL